MIARNKAFSLVELMVVIAVAGILAVILTATFQKVWESSLNTKCVNRLRTTASAVHMFVSENNGVFRSWARGNANTGSYVWGKSLVDGGLVSKETLRCPAGADKYPLNDGAWYHNTYGFNMIDANGDPMQPQGSGQDYQLRFASVAKPSGHIMLADSATLAFITPEVRSETFRVNINKSTDGVQLRHHGRINAAFMDGHIEALDRERALDFFDESVIYEDNK